jgi:hypothetical protein
MIISGGSRSQWRKFAAHLMKTEGGQQRVAIEEIRGLAADNLVDAFHELEALGQGTRATNFYYHANIDPRADEHMTEEQWENAVDMLEKNLGLEGHSRFVVEHEKHGRTHRHVVWSRVDTDHMRVVPDEWDYSIHQRTADELEKEFGHEKTPRRREPGQSKGPENWEYFRGKESRINPKEVQTELTALWHQADTPQAFAAALAEKDYILCEGDRGLCVVDQAGKEHSLYRRVGERKAVVDDRMEGIDRESLPTVAEARALARERTKEHGARKEREDAQPDPLPPSFSPSPAPALAPSPSPQPQPSAAPSPRRRKPSRFMELAEEALHSLKTVFTRKDAAAPEQAADIFKPEAGSFERIAEKLARGAGEAAPILETAAATAAIVEGEHAAHEALHEKKGPAATPEPSAFERMARERKQAIRETTSDDELISAGIDWLARKTGTPLSAALPPGRELTAFERMAEETKAALRENGGQPYTTDGVSFWQQSIALANAAAERLAGWVKGSWQELVERFTRGRDPAHDEPGLER